MTAITLTCILIFCLCFRPEAYELLSKDTTSILKAALPFFILFHHINLNYGIMSDFHLAGYYVVGVFFFISGYGLEYKKEHGQIQMKGIFKRLKKILIPIIVPAAAYVLIMLSQRDYSIEQLMEESIGWKVIIPYSWFIVTIIILTTFFYAICCIAESNFIRLCALLLLLVAFSVGCKMAGTPNTYHTSNFSFFAGVIAYNKRSEIECFIKRTKRFIVPILFILSLFLTTYPFPFALYFYIPMWSTLVVICVSVLHKRRNIWVKNIESVSYEFYLSQGITFALFLLLIEMCPMMGGYY